jgi:hypothetical protein
MLLKMATTEKTKPKRDGWVISLTPPEIEIVDKLWKQLGMAKQELVRRVFSWFSEQDDLVQKVILRVAPGGRMRSAVADALREIADEMDGEKSPSPDDAELVLLTPPRPPRQPPASDKPKDRQHGRSLRTSDQG